MGIASGVYEVGVGIANTPAAIQASAEGKEWDPSTNSWIFYDLKKEEQLYICPQKPMKSSETTSTSGERNRAKNQDRTLSQGHEAV